MAEAWRTPMRRPVPGIKSVYAPPCLRRVDLPGLNQIIWHFAPKEQTKIFELMDRTGREYTIWMIYKHSEMNPVRFLKIVDNMMDTLKRAAESSKIEEEKEKEKEALLLLPQLDRRILDAVTKSKRQEEEEDFTFDVPLSILHDFPGSGSDSDYI